LGTIGIGEVAHKKWPKSFRAVIIARQDDVEGLNSKLQDHYRTKLAQNIHFDEEIDLVIIG
jgi:hypothetical protein